MLKKIIAGFIILVALIIIRDMSYVSTNAGIAKEAVATTQAVAHPQSSEPRQVQSISEMAGARKDYAATLDHEFLNAAIESRTVATGTTLTIHCFAAGRVFAQRITDEKLGADFSFVRLKKLGFKKLVLTDDDDTTFVWDVAKYAH